MKRHELVADHIKRISPRYRDSDREQKKRILDEFCHTWEIGRKYAIRLLGSKTLKGLSAQSDCGSEFLNYVMMKLLQNRPQPVIMTRSRPYHKNDNAHVCRRTTLTSETSLAMTASKSIP